LITNSMSGSGYQPRHAGPPASPNAERGYIGRHRRPAWTAAKFPVGGTIVGVVRQPPW